MDGAISHTCRLLRRGSAGRLSAVCHQTYRQNLPAATGQSTTPPFFLEGGARGVVCGRLPPLSLVWIRGNSHLSAFGLKPLYAKSGRACLNGIPFPISGTLLG